ncbi:MAG: AAA family ATPase, partial [Pseudomonadota bacterium]
MKTYTKKDVEKLIGAEGLAAATENHEADTTPPIALPAAHTLGPICVLEESVPDWVTAKLMPDEGFRRAWNRTGPTTARDASAADVHLLTVVLRIKPDLTDAQTGELLTAFRSRYKAKPSKARRKDYVVRTLKAAKEMVRTEQMITDHQMHSVFPGPAYTLNFRTLAQLKADVGDDNTPKWLVERILERDGLGILGAFPKNAKSILVVHLAAAVASGKPFLGKFPVPISGPVVYIAAEDNKRTVYRRFNKIARGMDIADVTALPIMVLCRSAVQFSDGRCIQALQDKIAELKPMLVIVDTLRAVFGGDENSSSEARGLVQSIQTLRDVCSSAFIFTHHWRKNQDDRNAGPGQRLRGSGDWHASAESLLGLDKKKKVSDFVLQTSIEAEHRDDAELEPYAFTINFE